MARVFGKTATLSKWPEVPVLFMVEDLRQAEIVCSASRELSSPPLWLAFTASMKQCQIEAQLRSITMPAEYKTV